MNPSFRKNPRRSVLILATGIAALLLPAIAPAATYHWDTNPNTAVVGNDITEGGLGIWDVTTANFTTSATDSSATTHNVWSSALNNLGTDTVVFGGAAGGTVTLNAFASGAQLTGSTSLGVTNLTFNTTGYNLTGTQTIRFIGTTGSITVAPGITATINETINGGGVGGYTVDSSVDINGGGTLNLTGGNSSVGFTINGNTTVQTSAAANSGGFSGFNLNTVGAGSTLRTMNTNVLTTPSSFDGGGTFDANGFSQAFSSLGGALSLTNSTATNSATISLTLINNNLTNTGVISDGTGKISIAFTGSTAQGSGFDTGMATQTFAGANTYTGSTTLGRSTVTLDFANAAAPASNILYSSGFVGSNVPNIGPDDGKLIIGRPLATVNIAASSVGTLANFILTGKASTTNSQAFSGLRLDANSAASVLLNPNATANTITLDLGSTIVRNSGSVINFATTNAVTALSANASVKTTAGLADAVLLDATGVAYATLSGRDWAAKNTANDTVLAVGAVGTAAIYTNNAAATLSGNATSVASGGAGSDTRLAADTTIATLRFANSGGRTGINLGGKILTTGGLLVSAAVQNSGSFLTGGTLKSPGTDVVVLNYSTNSRWFGLGATVANGAGSTGLTTGGTVITQLFGNNTYDGVLTVQQGGLIVTGTNAPASVSINGSTTNVMGGQLPSNGTSGNFLQLGNANALGSIGTGVVDIGAFSILAVKRTDNLTINNNLRGVGGFSQGGSGTTSLVSAATAKYTYAGDTTVTAGTLKLDYAASSTGIINDTSALRLGGGTVEYATAADTAHNDAVRDTRLISGASTITKTGTGTGRLRLNTIAGTGAGSTLNLTANAAADTDTTNSAGILLTTARITVGGADWALNSTNGGDGAIQGLAAYGALAFSAGTDTLNSLQALTGTVTFGTAGARVTNTLKLTNTSAAPQILDIAAGNTLTLTAGGLLVTGTDAVQITNGTLRSNTATNSDLVIHQYNSGGLAIGSVIANGNGASTLTKTGTGLLTLSGTNTYTGQTYLNGGTTSISSNANLGNPVNGATLNLNNATLNVSADVILSNGAVGTNNRTVNLNGIGGTFDVDATRTLTIGANIGGPGGLTKSGNGTLELRAASYSGPTSVTGGTLKYGAAVNNFYSTLSLGATGTLDIAGNNNATGSLEGSGTVTNTGAVATLTFGALHTDTTFSGTLTNAASALNIDKYGAGIFTLTSGAHTYTGSTFVSGGSFILSGSGALPDTTTVGVSSATSTFDISGITAAGETIGSLLGAVGSSVILGAKDLTIGGTASNTYAGVISGLGGTLTKTGTGTQTLSGANTYDGVTTITQGILSVANASGLGTTAGNTVINSNGRVDATGGGQLSLTGGISVAENITVQGTGDAANFQRAISGTGGTNTITGTITLTGTGSYRIGGTLNLGPIVRSTAFGGGITFDPFGGQTLNINSVLDNNGGTITAHAGGTVVFNVAGNDLGKVFIQNATTIRTTVADALTTNQDLQLGQGTLANGAGGVNNDVGTFVLAGVNQTVNALVGFANSGANATTGASRKITNSVAATTSVLTVGFGGGSGSFDGDIENGAGTMQVEKVGTGTQTFSGAQNYSQLTTTGGVTNVNGSFTGGTATVNANATTNFGASQTLAALNIGANAVVTLVASPPAFAGGGDQLQALAVVPEPGTIGLLLCGALGLASRRRRRPASL